MLGRVLARQFAFEREDGVAMTSKPGDLTIKSKIWIEDGSGKMVFGSGRLVILLAVQRHGSLHAAAKELGMSYRAVWGKLKATEERLGQPLLTKRTGGSRGGGSELTPFAETLLERFQQLDSLTRATADTLFQGVFVKPMAQDASAGED
jgi:molybdate transport system regulatory protein